MKSKILVMPVLILLFQNLTGYAQVNFEKIYYTGDSLRQDFYHDVILASNGDILVMGQDDIIDSKYLYRIDPQGNIVWAKTYGDGISDFDMYNICELTDNNFILTTVYHDTISSQYYNCIIKINGSGDVIWSKKHLAARTMEGVVATANAGFTVVGGYTDSIVSQQLGLIVNFDSAGTVLWSRSYGDVSWWNRPLRIYNTNNGGYYINGTRVDTLGGNWEFYTVRTDSMGNPLWSKVYGSDMLPLSATHTSDDGLIMTGHDWYYRPIIIKVDSTGNTSYSYYFTVPGTNGCVTGAVEVSPSEITVFGFYNSGKLFLEKLLTNGTTVWKREYALNKLYTGIVGLQAKVFRTSDGGYVFPGEWELPNWRLAMIKTDSLGLAGCNTEITPVNLVPTAIVMPPTSYSGYDTVQISFVNASVYATPKTVLDSVICYTISSGISEQDEIGEISVIPNPSDGNIKISFPEFLNKGIIQVYEVTGNMILKEEIDNESNKNINLVNIKDGIYFLKVTDGEKEYYKKLVIENN